jgi:hypothetical protein
MSYQVISSLKEFRMLVTSERHSSLFKMMAPLKNLCLLPAVPSKAICNPSTDKFQVTIVPVFLKI